MVFHQNTKHRDFISGLVPQIGGDSTTFKVSVGKLYQANEHALKADGAALVRIDEINRGPAVQVFGGSIVAIESDKRLAPDGQHNANTQVFDLLDPNGALIEYALSHDLYILAAMNQADTSVEPLDVAFLRRWSPFRLEPDAEILRAFFGLGTHDVADLPDAPTSVADVYSAAVQAWTAINSRIGLGRGSEFCIGHGVLMQGSPAAVGDLPGALRYIAEGWKVIRAHVDEVFFGDLRGVAAALNVRPEVSGHLYSLEDRLFADEPRVEIVGPDPVPDNKLYSLLRAVSAP